MRHTYDKPISTRLVLSAAFALVFFFWVSYQSHTAKAHASCDGHSEEVHDAGHDAHSDHDDHGHDHSHEGHAH